MNEYPTIVEFLKARLDEIRPSRMDLSVEVFQYIAKNIEMQLQIVEWHSNWPVLLETKAELTSVDDYDIDNVVYTMQKNIQFLTEQEYIKKFGIDPPTAPILKIMAKQFWTHPDYNPDWSK